MISISGCTLPTKDYSMDYIQHRETLDGVDALNQEEFKSELMKSPWKLCKDDHGRAYKAKKCKEAK